MGYPSPIHFLRRVSKADEYNVQVRTVASFDTSYRAMAKATLGPKFSVQAPPGTFILTADKLSATVIEPL